MSVLAKPAEPNALYNCYATQNKCQTSAMTAKTKYLSILACACLAYIGYTWLAPQAVSMRVVSTSCEELGCNYELILKSESSAAVNAELRMLAFGIPTAVAPTQTYRSSREFSLLPNETKSVSGFIDIHFPPASLEVSLYKWQELK